MRRGSRLALPGRLGLEAAIALQLGRAQSRMEVVATVTVTFFCLPGVHKSRTSGGDADAGSPAGDDHLHLPGVSFLRLGMPLAGQRSPELLGPQSLTPLPGLPTGLAAEPGHSPRLEPVERGGPVGMAASPRSPALSGSLLVGLRTKPSPHKAEPRALCSQLHKDDF